MTDRAYFLAQCSNAIYESPERLGAWFAALPDWSWEPEDLIAHEETSTLSLLALNRSANELLICFKGSHELRDWLRSLTDSELVPWAHPAGECLVNAGFSGAWASVRAPILARLETLLGRLDPERDATIHLTGHSLGGALATLAAADLIEALALSAARRRGLSVCTFGAPAVGDQRFAEFYASHVHRLLLADRHYVAADDPVDAWLNEALESPLARWLIDGTYARLADLIKLPASEYLNGHTMENYIALLAAPAADDQGPR
ncbi:MAG TPA: lipase family protein [Herpetosiphonaceae bacterium]